ncbi:MAG: sodium:solute symporter family protein, partial [Candidatus Thermoplasmatota archaeon]
LIPYASVQLMGIGYLLSGLTPSSFSNMYLIGVLLAASFSTIASLVAGMKSVSWTDAFQALTMLFASIALLLFVFYHFFGSPALFVSTVSSETPGLLKLNWDFKMFVGLSLPWAFFAVTNPQVSQRMFVSDSSLSLKRMIIYFSIFGFIYTLITTLLGLSIANIGGLSFGAPDQAIAALLSNIPVALGLVVFVSIFAAATSTLGSIILTLSSIGSRDLIKNLNRDISESKELLYGKLLIVGIIVVCVIFANLRLDLIAVLSSMASGGLLVMAPTIVGTFFWKRSTAEGAITSMGIGGLLTASLYITGWYPFGWWPSVWGLIVTVTLYVGISYMTEPPEHTEKFLEKIEKGVKNNGFK